MTEEQLVQRGWRAKRLLDDADVQQAFADIETDIFTEWRRLRADQAAERESLHAANRALERVRNKLQAWADELTRRNLG